MRFCPGCRLGGVATGAHGISLSLVLLNKYILGAIRFLKVSEKVPESLNLIFFFLMFSWFFANFISSLLFKLQIRWLGSVIIWANYLLNVKLHFSLFFFSAWNKLDSICRENFTKFCFQDRSRERHVVQDGLKPTLFNFVKYIGRTSYLQSENVNLIL